MFRSTNDLPLDGVSVAPLLRGTGRRRWPDRMIFSHWNGKVSVRTQQYRLDSAGKLFDMVQDPGQTRDVARAHPEVAGKLSEAVARWRQDVLSDLKTDDRPFTVGYRAFPTTYLPARDGVAHGQIRRSAGAELLVLTPTGPARRTPITWDIEVATGGRYEVVIYYTCTAADVGSTLELSFHGSILRGKVTEAHDPPAHGAEHDRVPRQGESLVKDFQPLRLGVVDLKPGRGPLTLRAVEIPGRMSSTCARWH